MGAARSILSKELFESLKTEKQIECSDDVELYDVSKKRLATRGRVKLCMTFGKDILEQEFIIMSDGTMHFRVGRSGKA